MLAQLPDEELMHSLPLELVEDDDSLERALLEQSFLSELLDGDDDLEGVLLAYRGERVLTQAATIHTYFPLVRVEVAANVLLFRPSPGMRLGAQGRWVWGELAVPLVVGGWVHGQAAMQPAWSWLCDCNAAR